MSETDPYVRDLRLTAATIVANHIRSTWHGHGEAVPYAVVEAGLALASSFLVDAFLIEEALTQAPEEADRYEHLRQLQCRGELRLYTLELDDGPAMCAVA
jgi:hypothetical protein